MLAWDIFKKAVLLIVDNLGAALRISAVPYGLVVAASVFLFGSLAPPSVPVADVTSFAPEMVFNQFIALLTQLAAFLWIAVAWHRYVLLQEGGQAWVPPFEGGLMLGYLGRSILLGLLIFAVLIAIVTFLSFAPLLAVPIAGIVSVILFYRLGLILPAGAVGRPINLGEAWRATQGQSGTVVVLAIITFMASLLIQLPTIFDAISSGAVDPDGNAQQLLEASSSPVSVVYNLVMNWLALLVGVSLLSTLYGHFVEGRPLD